MEKTFLLYLSVHWGDLIERTKKVCHIHFKGHGHDIDEWRNYDEDNVPFGRLEKVYVPDEDSLVGRGRF